MTSLRPRPRPGRSTAAATAAPPPHEPGAVRLPEVRQERVEALRRMKRIAIALLLLAAAVYIICRAFGDGAGVWGYVQATAEASMVGGLADWFAVTAIFRRPLGLPIPHTAIIPAKKDQIGEGLATFVREYFLTTEVVSERVSAAHVPERMGQWLADPTHARRLSEELSIAVSGMAGMLRDDQIRDAVAGFADRRLRELDIAPLLARLIDAVCDSGQHQATLTLFLKGTKKFLDANRGEFRRRVDEQSWLPSFVDEQLFNAGFSWTQGFLTDVIAQPEHELRGGFDRQLRELAEQLRSDPERIARVEAARDQLLDHPSVRSYLANLWDAMKKLLLDETGDPDSELRRSVTGLTVRAGEVLRDDPVVRDQVNDALRRLSGHVATNYADDLADVISSTVARWDTDETSRRLELQVGRDLQFIRINGTVVGALAGLAIHLISQLV